MNDEILARKRIKAQQREIEILRTERDQLRALVDSATAPVAAPVCDCEKLKAENDELRRQVAGLRMQLGRYKKKAE